MSPAKPTLKHYEEIVGKGIMDELRLDPPAPMRELYARLINS